LVKYARVVGRAFQHDRSKAGLSVFAIDDAQGMKQKDIMPYSNVQQQSGCWV